jgi:hypothetical protein
VNVYVFKWVFIVRVFVFECLRVCVCACVWRVVCVCLFLCVVRVAVCVVNAFNRAMCSFHLGLMGTLNSEGYE